MGVVRKNPRHGGTRASAALRTGDRFEDKGTWYTVVSFDNDRGTYVCEYETPDGLTERASYDINALHNDITSHRVKVRARESSD